MLAELNDPDPITPCNGEMCERIRNFNWAQTSVGPIETWPENLIIMVNLLLDSKFPMFLCWGEDKIQFYNDAYRSILGTSGDGKHPYALGQKVETTWQELWPTIYPNITRIYETGESVYLEDQLIPIYREGHLEEVYWTFSYSPVRGQGGHTDGLLVVCTETTRQVQMLRRQETLRNLAFKQTGLKTQSEICASFMIEISKNPYDVPFALIFLADQDSGSLKYSGSTGIPFKKDIISVFWKNPSMNKAYTEGHSQQIENVMTEIGEVICPHYQEQVEKAFVLPLFHSNRSEAFGTLVMGISPRKRINADYLHFMELAAVTLSTNLNQVSEANKQLITRSANKITKDRVLQIIKQAPIAIAILKDREFVIETANDLMLSIWGKSEKIFNMTLAEALPQIKGKKFLDLLEAVRTSGNAYYGYEEKIVLKNRKTAKEHYFNFIYQPIKINTENTSRIMMVATDVTELVTGRKELEKAYEQLHLSKEAAELGTFDADLINHTLKWDERCRALFGIFHSDIVTFEKDFLPAIHEDDRERVFAEIKDLYNKKTSDNDYDAEYRVVGIEDHKLRWLRAKGKVYFTDNNQAQRFIGSVFNITDKKQDEERMNNFLEMVSHELKTPLTAMKANVQLLKGRAKELKDSFGADRLAKLEMQVNKMNSMIHGFVGVSHPELYKISLKKRKFSLNKMVLDIVAESILNVPSHVISTIHSEPCEVYADPDKISYVIKNLLNNAIKYSMQGRKIDVQCSIINGNAQVSVKDEGIGIKQKDIKKLFDRYYRVSNRHTSNTTGFGIGLYLCAEIIQGHGGNIWVNSDYGKGAEFFFDLPLGKKN